MPKINPDSMNLTPKQFCDSSLFGFGKEFLCCLFGSGNAIIGLAFNPIHFKQIVNAINITLKQYEEKHGEIKIVDNSVISPIQIDDLGKGSSEGNQTN